ncbi:MAG: glutamate synthase subunit alpha [Lentisphaerae bacterium GWF2_45_14]|nr:MAG: glutamate synthase subunit alpha [Lentisphaerae bacterium GWF2_45_14]
MTEFKRFHPGKIGLYDFKNEHDACGVGFVVNIDGTKTHKIIEQGIEVLVNLQHRGALGSDNSTGDGAGMLFQMPDEFFKKTAEELGFKLPEAGDYAVGMIFMPDEPKLIEICRSKVDAAIIEEGLSVLAWRNVPTDKSGLGKLASDSCPSVKQVFIGKGKKQLGEEEFERKLYTARRMAEKEMLNFNEIGEAFYVCSMSSRTIVYKGLLLAPQIPEFYSDLRSPEMKSALAVVHQRYSTNTFPTWRLAHPFRYIAHNGEINTLQGNVNSMRAREKAFKSEFFPGNEMEKILPIIQPDLSDSACFDNAFEFFVANDRSMPHTAMMMVPEAWGEKYRIGSDLKGFFEYHAGLMEPWDGPAAIVFSDGRRVGACLDRNGLRPARYTITKDNFMVLASETGVLDIDPANVARKGRLGAGQILYVDIDKKRVLFNREIKMRVARSYPYRRWVEENKIPMSGLIEYAVNHPSQETLLRWQRLFGYTREEINMLLTPMFTEGKEGTGSMGNDAALAVLSSKPQLLFAYFKQLFAQVTNPPIDPIREELVMSLTVFIGNKTNILECNPGHAQLVKLKSPVLTEGDIQRLRNTKLHNFQAVTISIAFPAKGDGKALEKAIEDVCLKAEKAVNEGKSVIILSDKNLQEGQVPIPSLLATAAVNHHLVRCGGRTSSGLVIETGEAREVMHIALLLGYGATAICPYLALSSCVDLLEKDNYGEDIDEIKALENYVSAAKKGILKIMSKMGISTLRSYRGAQIFEAVGLNSSLVDKYFCGTASRIEGIALDEVAREANMRYEKAYNPAQGTPDFLEAGGQYHFRLNEEKHLWTPETISKLQQATRTNNMTLYKEYASYINNQTEHLCTLRGLFKFKKAVPVPLDEVESVESIIKRFVTGAMSFGSISKETHETVAAAMNRIGGMSNSGEGGEDPARYKRLPNGDSLCSAIKQVASARFGVTIEYLANARELQIKIAQGAKPGEGGQLPGHKVNKEIAKVRHATPGVTLISPPPHHDIYSIEDLAQLIYDLKCANPEARISVKLVSEVGVGTVAAGVAKGHADLVLISGHDGGTGASPLTSIKHAGLPWELGLAETQQTLVLNHLRDRIRVQADGQMKTGRDITIAALLGAEEFGFGTAILVVCGCVMMRKCHSNTCPVGVATQDPELRKLFSGKPEYIVNFLKMIASEVREYMAELGFRNFDDMIGRSDLLEMNRAIDFWKAKNLDFSKIFERPSDPSLPVRCLRKQDHGIDKAFDQKLIELTKEAVEEKKKISFDLSIRNVDRTAGTMLSGLIAKKYGLAGLPENTIKGNFTGCAGQSFGAFLIHGITFTLTGESNDYLGKGLSGGRIIVKPPKNIENPEKNVIAGNVLLYGATGGEVYINGRAGERFAIRNSGAVAVVEGVGDHGCEYMTGGRVVVIGPTGVNFAAGMSGGIAYVYDQDFNEKCNLDMVDLDPVLFDEDRNELRAMIEKHLEYTGSPMAKIILDDWENEAPKFVKVFPVEYKKVLGKMIKEDEEVKREVMLY